MPICPSCRQEVPARAKFCDSCGATLKHDSGTVQLIRKWIIGGNPDCDLVVDDPRVSGQHCLLLEAEGGFLLEDLGSTNGTFVNDIRITARVKVTRADSITLGQSVPMPWPKQEKPSFSRAIRIGREPDNDISLDYPMISGHHARILVGGGKAIIEDLGSMNGTAIGRPENKIKRSPLTKDDTVFFGSFRIPASRLLPGKLTMGQTPQAELEFKGQEMTLGRNPECDHMLDYPMVSWRHAKLSHIGGVITVEDLGSTNGTFVNGRRITGPVTVNQGDVISLGSYTLRLTSAGTFEKRDYRGNLTVEARNVTVDVPGKRLLEEISLTIYPSELVGLMGPSGAGKTTLMMALNGYTRPSYGSVLFNGVDLYQNYNHFCGHIGYVPQEDIMHRELTVRQALYYTARLRLPSDTSDAEIEARIQTVLAQLGIESVADVIIGSPEKKGISGGQRKRVNLAMELLTDPSLLILDEPTSGLASDDALMVMKKLKQLADAGKTILITIHQPGIEIFKLMDSLVVIGKDKDSPQPGRLVYFGPAYPDSINFFDPNGVPGLKPGAEPGPDRVLDGLRDVGAEECVRRYAASSYKRDYVDARAGQLPPGLAQDLSSNVRRQFGLGQWWTLVRRCFNIKLKDLSGTAILLTQAPIIALLIAMIFGKSESDWVRAANATRLTIFLMSLAALWFGCSNSAREIVSEMAIYRRERLVNLKIPSYVASKFTVLGLLCLLQCAILLGIVKYGCDLQGPWLPMYGVLILTALTGVALGLTASSLARTQEFATSLVPIILLPMIILGGALKARHDMPWPGIAQVMASRWSYESLLLIESGHHSNNLVQIPVTPPPGADARTTVIFINEEIDIAEQHFPENDSEARNVKRNRTSPQTGVLVLMGMFAVLVVAIMGILKWRDTRR
jgi:ABC-type multidrug transport system ATPase subunit